MRNILIVCTLFSALLCSAQTIFIAGDSTARNYKESEAPMAGWGQMLSAHLKSGVKVDNRAISGQSVRSFRKHWVGLLREVKPGDYVLIQFGHNDQKPQDPDRYADDKTDYRTFLKQYVAEVREAKANPVLITSIARRHFFGPGGALKQSLENYPQAMREVAAETGTPLIDANQLTMDWLTLEGKENTTQYFNWSEPGEYPSYPQGSKDNTHLSKKGAEAVAAMIVEDAQKQKLPLASCFKE